MVLFSRRRKVILKRCLSKARQVYFSLYINQRLYINAIISLMIFIVGFKLGFIWSKGFLFVFLGFWIAVITIEMLTLYKKIYESILGKGFLIILLSLCTNFSIVLSSQYVNEITKIDPSKFPHTITLLSILSIPFFVVIGFSLLYFILLFVTPLMFMFHTMYDDKTKKVLIPGYLPNNRMPYHKLTRFIQFISITLFCSFVLMLKQKNMRDYDDFLKKSATSFLYNWEMYPQTQCNIPSNSRVAFIGDKEILIGTKSSAGIEFNISECSNH